MSDKPPNGKDNDKRYSIIRWKWFVQEHAAHGRMQRYMQYIHKQVDSLPQEQCGTA